MAIPNNLPNGGPQKPSGSQRPPRQGIPNKEQSPTNPQQRGNGQRPPAGQPQRPSSGSSQGNQRNTPTHQGQGRTKQNRGLPTGQGLPRPNIQGQQGSRQDVPTSPQQRREQQSQQVDRTPQNRPQRPIQQPVPTREPIQNKFDVEEGDPFSPITTDEQMELDNEDYLDEFEEETFPETSETEGEDGYEEEDVEDYHLEDNEPEVEKTKSKSKDDKKAKPSKSKKPNRRLKDKKGQHVFVDEEKQELEPYGGKKNLKESDFDRRKNLRTNSIIVQWVVITLLLGLLGLGIKNTFFPPEGLTEEEVVEIAAITSSVTGFPVEEGKGFATDFMRAYLTANADEVSNRILNYYYTGSMAGSDPNIANRTVSNNYKQEIVYGPTVYEAHAFNRYSARYTIGALTQPSPVSSEDSTPAEPRWEFFNVNVYHNEVTDTFTITGDSPTVVPAVEVGEVSKLPARALLGTGESNQELAAAVQSVVHGFLQGYATSTSSSHAALDQYISDSNNPDLVRGLGGLYEFAGSVDNSVQFTAYPTVSGSLDEAKVLATVRWANKLGNGDDASMRIEYTSTYVLSLEKVGGKYLVTRFQPQYYESEKAVENIQQNEG